MIIPFYGATDPEMFRIERDAMDRAGLVVDRLDELLPAAGVVLDVGAGNGHTAGLLTTPTRRVVAAEPAEGMIDGDRNVTWVQAPAQHLPFVDDAFDGAYATWAYFFPAFLDISDGLAEVRRVTRPGTPIVIVDNAGEDEFTAMASSDIGTDFEFWNENGFGLEVIQSTFSFKTIGDAETLLTFFFGDQAEPALDVQFRIAVMTGVA